MKVSCFDFHLVYLISANKMMSLAQHVLKDKDYISKHKGALNGPCLVEIHVITVSEVNIISYIWIKC